MLRGNSELNTIDLPINRGFSYEKRHRHLKIKAYWHYAKIKSHH